MSNFTVTLDDCIRVFKDEKPFDFHQVTEWEYLIEIAAEVLKAFAANEAQYGHLGRSLTEAINRANFMYVQQPIRFPENSSEFMKIYRENLQGNLEDPCKKIENLIGDRKSDLGKLINNWLVMNKWL